MSALQNRVYWGGALSGRDLNGVNKTVSGLLKLLHPNAETPVSDEDLEWAVRLALVVPSPKFHCHDVGIPVEASLNCTACLATGVAGI